MPNEMNHAEVAEILEDCMRYFLCARATVTSDNSRAVMQQRADTLRKVAADERRIANGELAKAVHAYWIKKCYPWGNSYYCSTCGDSENKLSNHCPNCGALMDGKDDNHA